MSPYLYVYGYEKHSIVRVYYLTSVIALKLKEI